MSEQEKIYLLEEIMDVEKGTLKNDDNLADFDEWDSLTALTFISEMDERFGKKVTGAQIKSFITVADAISIME